MSHSPRHSLKTTRAKSALGIAAAAALGIAPLVEMTAVPAIADSITDSNARQNTCAVDLVGVNSVDPAAGYSTPRPIDRNVNVYAGGDFTSVKGSELEGRLVVGGDATIDNSGLGNLVAAGGGSGLTPEPGSTFVRIGGDFTLKKSVKTSTWQGADSKLPAPGGIKVGGEVYDASDIEGSDNVIVDSLGHDDALEQYNSWGDHNFALLSDIANNDWTAGTDGTTDLVGDTLTLNGNPTATYHRFTVDSSDFAGGIALNIGDDIAQTDAIVIKVTGDSTVDANVKSVQDDGSDIVMSDRRFGQLASQILWIFPDQTDVTISGGQVPGSILVLDRNSTTTVAAGGSNGRVWVAGDLVQDRGGTEFHAFPFIGDDEMICSADDPTLDPSDTPTDEPTTDSNDPTDPDGNESNDPGDDETDNSGTEEGPGDNGDSTESDESTGSDGETDSDDDAGSEEATDSDDNAASTDNGSVTIEETTSTNDSDTDSSATDSDSASTESASDDKELADTGSDLTWLPLGATALALMGAGLIAVTKRRARRS